MIDVDQITRKSKLAKEMVKLGIVSNYEEASRKIDEESLVKASGENLARKAEIRQESPQRQEFVPKQPFLREEKSFLQVPEHESPQMLNKSPESQQNLDFLIKRINMLELQLEQAHQKIEQKTKDNDQRVDELVGMVNTLNRTLNEFKKEWKSAEHRSASSQSSSPSHEEAREKPKNPRVPEDLGGFDPSVENIFSNRGDRITNKFKK